MADTGTMEEQQIQMKPLEDKSNMENKQIMQIQSQQDQTNETEKGEQFLKQEKDIQGQDNATILTSVAAKEKSLETRRRSLMLSLTPLEILKHKQRKRSVLVVNTQKLSQKEGTIINEDEETLKNLQEFSALLLKKKTIVLQDKDNLLKRRSSQHITQNEKSPQLDIFNLSDKEPPILAQDGHRRCLWAKQHIQRILTSSFTYALFMALCSCAAIFNDHIRYMSDMRYNDLAFDAIFIFVLCVFILDLALRLMFIPQFLLSLFCLFDAVSTIALVFDLSWAQNALHSSAPWLQTQDILQLARASGLSRFGTRMARLLRTFNISCFNQLKEHYQKDSHNHIKPTQVASSQVNNDQINLNLKQVMQVQEQKEQELTQQSQSNRKPNQVMPTPIKDIPDEYSPCQSLYTPSLQPINADDQLSIAESGTNNLLLESQSPSSSHQASPKLGEMQIRKRKIAPNLQSINNTAESPIRSPTQRAYQERKRTKLSIFGPVVENKEQQILNYKLQIKSLKEGLSPLSPNTKRKHVLQIYSIQSNVKKELQGLMIQEAQRKIQMERQFKESRVGKQLSTLTTKRVVLLVLIFLLLLPLFDDRSWDKLDQDDTYVSDFLLLNNFINQQQNQTGQQQSSLNELQIIYQRQALAIQQFITRYAENQYPIIQMSMHLIQPVMNNNTIIIQPNFVNQLFQYNNSIYFNGYPSLRSSEVYNINLQSNNYFNTNNNITDENICQIDIRYKLRKLAKLQFFKMLFVCIILATGALMFSVDAHAMVLRPIEHMIQKVNMIAKNPLVSKDLQKQKMLLKEHKQLMHNKNQDYEQQEDEMDLIENSILKIGSLLAIGFGQAGSQIISENMRKEGDVNPMLPGVKKHAIFGFCDIRNFNELTNILEEEILRYVNNISNIVHKQVDRFQGSTNKNMGDAFLLTWIIPDDLIFFIDDELNACNDVVNKKQIIARTAFLKNLSDMSVICFLKILANLNKKAMITQYDNLADIQQEFKGGFKTSMGCGLHVGWGIEGAIGSCFKIDASYLSPNVNMAARLEAATKQYHQDILISGDLYRLLSNKMQRYARQVDNVTVKGSIKPIALFTFDLDYSKLPKQDFTLKSVKEKERSHQVAKEFFAEILNNSIERDSQESGLHDEVMKINTFLEEGRDFQLMFHNSFGEWRIIFDQAFLLYIEGEWLEAKDLFNQCLKLLPNDGPSQTLLAYIEQLSYIAPDNWIGYRELTQK